MIYFRGLTWDHPRGYKALEKASVPFNRLGKTQLHWDRQPLEGFESHPIADLATKYDLLVLDHPHIGEAVAAGCLRPLNDFYSPEQIAQWKHQTIGRALQSYEWRDELWALPLDVASQVMAYRPDLIGGRLPTSWEEVLELSEWRHNVVLSLGGPHAFLTMLSIAASMGHVLTDESCEYVPASIVVRALNLMQRLFDEMDGSLYGSNPIQLLERMSQTDEIGLIPLIFGYVNYAVPQHGNAPLRFAEVPSWTSNVQSGSVLGGTGIAFTKRCKPNQDLLCEVARLLSETFQIEFIPSADGQPSAKAAWLSSQVNQKWGGFYKNTFKTVQSAFVRPRFAGWIACQTSSADVIRNAIRAGVDHEQTAEKLRQIWSEAYPLNGI